MPLTRSMNKEKKGSEENKQTLEVPAATQSQQQQQEETSVFGDQIAESRHHSPLPIFPTPPLSHSFFNAPAPPPSPIHKNWTCCSKEFDPRCLTYFVQVSVCLVVLIFCFIQLSSSNPDDGLKNFWLSTVGLIVGNFMPSLSQFPEYGKK